MARIIKYTISFILFLSISTGYVISQIRFDQGSQYSYLKGSEASALSDDWTSAGFDDSGWETGPAPFWYGDGAGGTMLADMRDNYSTLYLRSTFAAENIHQLKEVKFAIDFDDGFVLWINGEEVLRQNAPSELNYNSFAFVNHESGVAETFTVDSTEVSLFEGQNTIAIQLLNVTISSSDIHFDMGITANPSLPELDSLDGVLHFSHDAGFFESPFELSISAPDSNLDIIYTLDGSNPRTSTTAFTGDSVVAVTIDPESTSGRAATPAVMVRASLLKTGFNPSIPETRTYIFVNKVRNQTYPGSPWPASNINGQVMDYDMDPEVVNDARYTSLIEKALLDIPSFSLVTDNDNLFHPSTGIYVNAENYGVAWERDCSLELIDPDGEGFQVNAGVRIRGGNSRNSNNPKHAFRMFFRGEYGDTKLEYPLFGDDGALDYDNIDLRTEQNYSWNMDGDPWGYYNTFVRDIYARKMQGEMGQPYTRSRYYHLYLNGLYWGLFMTEERPEASYAESYFGDDKLDYDVVKVTTQPWPYYNIVTDGNMDAWEEVWDLTRIGFSTNERYFRLEGKDADGNPAKDSKVYVDIENLIDYMIMIFYTGSYDAPVSAWGGEVMPNNYYGIYNRKNRGTGFIFVAHDMEQCLFVDQIAVAEGLYENRVTIPEMRVTDFLKFHPQWLHHRLCSNAEYRLRFADRAHIYLREGGLFTEEVGKEKFMEFARIIDTAIVAESARWGDAKVSDPRTRDDDWIPALEQVTDVFFPNRTGIVIDQLLAANLYSRIDPPGIQVSGEIVKHPVIYFEGTLSVSIGNNNGSGEIFYTIDGNDPRLIGGSASPGSIPSSTDVVLEISQSTIIKARIKDGNEWSAIAEVVLANRVEDYTNLRVTELHYHPTSVFLDPDTIDDLDMEFIEFKNTGSHTIDISGLKLDSAVYYTVPEASFLAPGDFYVIASKPEVFYDIYSLNPSGNYSGHFSNAGEYVLLTDPQGKEILSFTYDDVYPWPLMADGLGYSLTSAVPDPEGNPDDYTYWMQSTPLGGSPFADDGQGVWTEPVLNDTKESQFRVFPNPARDYFTIQADGQLETRIQIYNNSGEVVYSHTFVKEATIPCDLIGTAGVYLIKLTSQYSVTTEKIMILK